MTARKVYGPRPTEGDSTSAKRTFRRQLDGIKHPFRRPGEDTSYPNPPSTQLTLYVLHGYKLYTV